MISGLSLWLSRSLILLASISESTITSPFFKIMVILESEAEAYSSASAFNAIQLPESIKPDIDFLKIFACLESSVSIWA